MKTYRVILPGFVPGRSCLEDLVQVDSLLAEQLAHGRVQSPLPIAEHGGYLVENGYF